MITRRTLLVLFPSAAAGSALGWTQSSRTIIELSALREISTTGSISAGSNQLVLTASSTFLVGDTVIVAVGGESGGGLRGTRGVGGTWPALSYATTSAMNADTRKSGGTYAWVEATGDVYQWYSGSWHNDPNLYYTNKVVPKALVARITAINGLALTLNASASVASTNANVYLDNMPAINAVIGESSSLPKNNVTLRVPAGSFAVSDRLLVAGASKHSWIIEGAGKDATTFFSPDGVRSATLWIEQSRGIIIQDLHLRGNAKNNGFFLNVAASVATPVNGNSAYPAGIYFNMSHDCTVRRCKITDAFQKAVGVDSCTNIWAYNCDCTLTDALQIYVQWMFQWANSTGGGAVDCTVTSPFMVAGFETFQSNGVKFTRCGGTNCAFSSNSSGNWLFDELNITIKANSQLSTLSWSEYAPVVQANANISPHNPLLLLGGTIRNPRIVQEGYINAKHDSLKGILFNVPNVTVTGGYPNHPERGGYIKIPNYYRGSRLYGANGLGADLGGANAIVDGIRVVGTSDVSRQGNIQIAAGVVRNCVADDIRCHNQANNQTNARYGR